MSVQSLGTKWYLSLPQKSGFRSVLLSNCHYGNHSRCQQDHLDISVEQIIWANTGKGMDSWPEFADSGHLSSFPFHSETSLPFLVWVVLLFPMLRCQPSIAIYECAPSSTSNIPSCLLKSTFFFMPDSKGLVEEGKSVVKYALKQVRHGFVKNWQLWENNKGL